MKKPLISHYPVIAMLSSCAGLKALAEAFENGIFFFEDSFSQKFLCKSVCSFFPDDHRREDFNNAIALCSKENFSKLFDFRILSTLADRLVEFDGSEIIFRHNEQDEAQTLTLQLHPYMLAARKSAEHLYQGHLSIKDIRAYANKISLGLFRNDNQHRKYADNHIHLNGAHDAGTSILNHCNEPFYYRKDESKNNSESGHLWNDSELNGDQVLHLLRASFNFLNRWILHPQDKNEDDFPQLISLIFDNILLKTTRVIPWDKFSLKTISQTGKNCPEEELLAMAIRFYLDKRFAASLFCFYNTLFYLDLANSAEKDKERFCLFIAIRIFIVASNVIRSKIVMSSKKGLKFFTDFFDSPFKKIGNKEEHGYDCLAQLNSDYSQVKVSPDFLDWKALKKNFVCSFKTLQVHNRSHRLLEAALSFGRDAIQVRQSNRFHKEMLSQYVIHFLKKDTKDNPQRLLKGRLKDERHASLRKKVKEEAEKILEFVNNPGNKAVSLFQILLGGDYDQLDLLQHQAIYSQISLDLTQFIVGLDAAGNECSTPPEVFAPAIRFLRHSPQPFKSNLLLANNKSHHKKFRLSMHAGEDFNHIITGLRRIDETVRFCEYGQFDRLGHTLALGISPKDWLKEKKEALLSRQDFFDNLVWLWHQCEAVGVQYPKALSFRVVYENLIIQLGRDLYGFDPEPKIQDYLKAWELRRNCPLSLAGPKTGGYLEGGSEFCPDYSIKETIETPYKLFQHYHYNFNQKQKETEEVICIRLGNQNAHDFDSRYYYTTEEELDFYEALQDFLITCYEDKGIIIEACPSSNVIICGFDISQHPIFRWNPPKNEFLETGGKFNRFGLRKSAITCCINTDDPAILHTTIQNEFELLKNVLKDTYGCSENESEQWVESLRKNGINIFMKDWCND